MLALAAPAAAAAGQGEGSEETVATGEATRGRLLVGEAGRDLEVLLPSEERLDGGARRFLYVVGSWAGSSGGRCERVAAGAVRSKSGVKKLDSGMGSSTSSSGANNGRETRPSFRVTVDQNGE